MKTIIIDDDPASHEVLKNLLEEHKEDLTFINSAFSVVEGKELIVQEKPDLVFLDIEIPPYTGFDLLQQVKEEYSDFKVIFVTGHGSLKYAMKAIQFETQYYLEKPILGEKLTQAIEEIKSENNKDNKSIINAVLELYQQSKVQEKLYKLPERFVIRHLKGRIYKRIEELTYLEANANYTKLFFHNSKPIVDSKNLGSYIDQFSDYTYIQQANRSYLVNLNHVEEYISEGDKHFVVLSDATKIKLTKLYKNKLLSKLDAI